MKQVVPVVFATDNNYVLPLAVAIQSLITHKNKNVELKIYVFYEDLNDDNKALLSCLQKNEVTIGFINVEQYIDKNVIYVGHWYSYATYYRIFAPIILSQYKKIVYLDCDLIVKKCISNFYNQDISGYPLGGVQDLTEVTGYVNAGVLLINCEEYLKQDIVQKCLDYLKENRDLEWLDQDTINGVCKDNIKLLDGKFNFQNRACSSSYWLRKSGVTKIKDISTLHFVSTNKPWAYSNYPLNYLWWKEVKFLPKNIKQLINEKYLKNINNDKFKCDYFKFHFANKFIKSIYKIKLFLTKKKESK